MSKVFLVHSESGEYSDWTFIPLAVFTTRERAVAWIEGRRMPVTQSDVYDGLSTDVWQGDEVVGYARPTTKDGRTWLVQATEDGRKVELSYDQDAWFIDELELDPERKGDA